MLRSLPFCSRIFGLAAAMSFTATCVAAPSVADAETSALTNTPVLVISDDEDPDSVRRSSAIVKRIIAELRKSLESHGFLMIDEESIATDFEWPSTDRRPRRLLIETIVLGSNGELVSRQIHALALFRVYARARKSSRGAMFTVRIEGEIYDVASGMFLNGFDSPNPAIAPNGLEFTAPSVCLESPHCVTEEVEARADEIAGTLGEVLARMLGRYTPPRKSGVGAGSESPLNAGLTTDGKESHGLVTPYRLTLRHFDDHEALTIVGVMAEEFPGYRSHALFNKYGAIRHYEYLSSTESAKLESWLHILLQDMGFDAKTEFAVSVQETEILVDKLFPVQNPPESPDEKMRD